MDKDEAIKLALDRFICEDGLWGLDDMPGYNRAPLRTCVGGNGILGLAQFILLSDHYNKDFISISDVLYRLRAVRVGDYHRNPNRYREVEMQDNYVAIEYLCAKFGFSKRAIEIDELALRTGGNINNVAPHKWTLKTQRQPGELAFYAICAGRRPPPLQFAAFLGGIIANLFDNGKADPKILTWMRLHTIDLLGYKSFFYRIVRSLWIRKLKKLGGIERYLLLHHTDPDNPINVLAKGRGY